MDVVLPDSGITFPWMPHAKHGRRTRDPLPIIESERQQRAQRRKIAQVDEIVDAIEIQSAERATQQCLATRARPGWIDSKFAVELPGRCDAIDLCRALARVLPMEPLGTRDDLSIGVAVVANLHSLRPDRMPQQAAGYGVVLDQRWIG